MPHGVLLFWTPHGATDTPVAGPGPPTPPATVLIVAPGTRAARARAAELAGAAPAAGGSATARPTVSATPSSPAVRVLGMPASANTVPPGPGAGAGHLCYVWV